MSARPLQLALIGILTLSLCACSDERDYGKETFPVTGKVQLDGQPGAMISVTLTDVNGFDAAAAVPAIPKAVTMDDGTFAISTFEAGDGAPAGEYTATFVLGERQGLSINTDNDKLKGKYSDPEKSEFKVTVKEGEPTDMGTIELTTK